MRGYISVEKNEDYDISYHQELDITWMCPVTKNQETKEPCIMYKVGLVTTSPIRESAVLAAKYEETNVYLVATSPIRESAVLAVKYEETNVYLVATSPIRESAVLAVKYEETNVYLVATSPIRESAVLAAKYAEPDIVTLKDVQEKVDVGSKVLIKGVVKKGQAVQKVGSKNLRMLRSTISDSSCTLFLTLWESEIDVIEDGKVYIFSNVSVRQNEQNKTLSTTRNTISSRVDNDEMEELDNTLAEEMLNENKQNVLTVKSFRSVEVDKYHTCVHCKKKVVPGVQGKIIKCTSCPHRMRFADCKIDIACRVYVKISDNENDETLVLTIFTDVLQQILTTNVIALTEDEISEKLLELENIRIVFGNDNIVMECTFQL